MMGEIADRISDGSLAPLYGRLPAMRPEAVENVRHLTTMLRTLPQTPFVTEHRIHGGMYARSACVPEGTVLTGALLARATIVILHGDALVYTGDDAPLSVSGYTVLCGSAGRKQAFVTRSEMNITMVFPTDAKTVEEAQAQGTDETDLLPPLSDIDRHVIIVTGE